jgi:hypothetical protein
MVTVLFFSLMTRIPAWFSPDETLQEMIRSTLPYVGVGNIALNYGYLCWYMVGAQGRYKLGAVVKFFAQWGITMPLAAAYTFMWHFDLQGLTSAVVCGNVAVGASLSFVLLTSKWDERAAKIQTRNHVIAGGETKKDPPNLEEATEEIFSALSGGRSRAARTTAKRNIILLTAPPGRLGFQIGTLTNRPGVAVTSVAQTSPFFGRLLVGDIILCVDGIDVTRNLPVDDVYKIMLSQQDRDRELTVLTTPGKYRDDDSNDCLGVSLDIPDFESFDIEGLIPG